MIFEFQVTELIHFLKLDENVDALFLEQAGKIGLIELKGHPATSKLFILWLNLQEGIIYELTYQNSLY